MADSKTHDHSLDNEKCPICKSDKYLNPTLKLLVSPCFHKMCESCINRLFLSGPAPCPICKSTLRKANFVQQTFEDLLVEKEIQIRKKVGRFFNKRVDDFNGDLRAFNDYLEEVEEIIFNLVYEIDLQETQDKVEKYKQENKEIISVNISKQLAEDRAALLKLEKQKREQQLRKEAYLALIEDSTKQKKKEQIELIDQLATANSDSAVKDLIKNSKTKKATHNVLYKIENVNVIVDDVDVDYLKEDFDDTPFEPFDGIFQETVYHAYSTNYTDPITQSFKAAEVADRLKAGGYVPSMTQTRSLISAFRGIFAMMNDTPWDFV